MLNKLVRNMGIKSDLEVDVIFDGVSVGWVFICLGDVWGSEISASLGSIFGEMFCGGKSFSGILEVVSEGDRFFWFAVGFFKSCCVPSVFWFPIFDEISEIILFFGVIVEVIGVFELLENVESKLHSLHSSSFFLSLFEEICFSFWFWNFFSSSFCFLR